MGRFARNKRDVFYRAAKVVGYRARSAYKLVQLDRVYSFLRDSADADSGTLATAPTTCAAVDLCAAPGSWSQVLAANPAWAPIVAVDLQEMAPIPRVTCVQGDITSDATAARVTAACHGAPVTLCLCDGAPDVTGTHDIDEYVQSSLFLSALAITSSLLQPGGTFVSKMFRGADMSFMIAQAQLLFRHVIIDKPASSRGDSIESFIICRGYAPPPDFEPSLSLARYSTTQSGDAADEAAQAEASSHALGPVTRALHPLLAAGDLNGPIPHFSSPLTMSPSGLADEDAAIRKLPSIEEYEALLMQA